MHEAFHRRLFLSGGIAGLAATSTFLAASPASATPLSFAVVTDTHADVDQPARTQWLGQVFSSIQRAAPAFVLNCGDITEYGGDGEYEAYLGAIPQSLRHKVRHVPGNHEVRWDVHGLELYERLLGPAQFSFDIGGLHVVGLNPTQLLQEPGYAGRDSLRWLESDLQAARTRPSLVFLHYPLGAEHYYVNDQDDLLRVLSDSPVRAVFAGHIHRQQVVRMNGFAQVAADDAKSAPLYYHVESGADAGHPVLRVALVALDADGGETRTEVTTIPLSGKGEGRELRPAHIDVGTPADGVADVTVRLPSGSPAASVRAQLYPQEVFGGGTEGEWTELRPSGNRTWKAQVDLGAAKPGLHRMQVRLAGPDGARFEATAAVRVAHTADTPPEKWRIRLPGSVQGALAERDGLIVAGTTSGRVEAFRLAGDRRIRAWSKQIGPVYRGAAFDTSGRIAFVPSAGHCLYALNTSNGKTRWRFRASGPVLSTPLVSTVGGVETVLFTAGRRHFALAAANGKLRWRADSHGFFAGRVACDGSRVYAGGGDGNAYAYDAKTGAELWSFSTTDRETAYSRLIYGPWDDIVELLPGNLVLVSTVANAYALDRNTGTLVWTVPGSHVYAPARVVGNSVLLIDEWGVASFVNATTGSAIWRSELPDRNRVLNAGPVIDGDTAYVVGTTGLFAAIDLVSGTTGRYCQLGPAQTFSTPVLVDSTLVTGDQAGFLRAIAVR